MSLCTHRQVFTLILSLHLQINSYYSMVFYLKRSCLIYNQIFTLPKDTLIYPAHDYKGYEVMQNETLIHIVVLQWLYTTYLCVDIFR